MQKAYQKLFFLSLLLLFFSCQDEEVSPSTTDEYSHNVASSWVNLALDVIKNSPGCSPPVAARTYGYLGLAMYEAARPGLTGYKSMGGQINGLSAEDVPNAESGLEYNWALAVNAAAAEILHACMDGARTENAGIIESNLAVQTTLFKSDNSVAVVERSLAYGQQVGQAIVEFAESDGQAQCYKTNFPANFVVPVGNGFWVPTSAQIIPLQPFWGNVRSFGPGNPDVAVDPPLPYSTDPNSPFYKEAQDVYLISQGLTASQKIIAEYWSDDPGKTATPPGHSLSIAKIVVTKQNANLGKAVETYAKVGMAVHDAFVSCWKTKYQYNLVRPITYIREQMNQSWTPILPTPPFPEYTSGHSVQSGAAAQVLESLYGFNYAFQDNTHEQRGDINGTPRNYVSFADFANEAAISRFYGGIHYKKAIYEGVGQGRLVGLNVLKLQFK